MEVLARAENLSDRHSGVDDSEAEGRDLEEDIRGSEDKAEDDGDVRSDEEGSYNVAQRAVSNALHRRGPILMHYINASGKCYFRPYGVL
jgi:hypothetical protein